MPESDGRLCSKTLRLSTRGQSFTLLTIYDYDEIRFDDASYYENTDDYPAT